MACQLARSPRRPVAQDSKGTWRPSGKDAGKDCCDLGAAGRQYHSFVPIELSMVGKWVDMLKEIVSGPVRCGKHSPCQTASILLEQNMNIVPGKEIECAG
jgi:hypothetical protein